MSGLTVAAYAGLLPLGQWQADEYLTFYAFREQGAGFLLQRMLEWSPRPLSEILLFLYAKVVDASGRQLVTPMLGVLWAALLAAAILPSMLLYRRDRRAAAPLLLISLAVLALFLSGHDVAEVFYWTQGAIAYMPTLAAILFFTLWELFAGPAQSRSRSLVMVSALSVAATASEMGTFFVVLFCGGMILVSLLKRAAPPGGRQTIQYVPPLLLGLGVLAFMIGGRFGSSGEIFGDAGIAHRFWPSLSETWHRFAGETFALGRGGDYTMSQLVWGLASKLMLGVAAFLVFRGLPVRQAGTGHLCVAVLLVATVGTAVLSLFGAFYQFGVPCCERHETMRECLVVLGIVIAARLGAAFRPRLAGLISPRMPLPVISAVLVGLSVLIANGWTFDAVRQEYGAFPQSRATMSRNWASGHSAGPDMKFVVRGEKQVVASAGWPLQTFERSSPNLPQNATAVLSYFGKSKVVFASPTSN